MNRRDVLLKALRNETTPRPAWLPFVGVHGAKLTGRTAREYLHSSDLILAGLRRANELYRPDGLPIVFANGPARKSPATRRPRWS